jgi:hypothetical protein
VLILPWNLKHEIVEQLSFIRDWGGRFGHAPELTLLSLSPSRAQLTPAFAP